MNYKEAVLSAYLSAFCEGREVPQFFVGHDAYHFGAVPTERLRTYLDDNAPWLAQHLDSVSPRQSDFLYTAEAFYVLCKEEYLGRV